MTSKKMSNLKPVVSVTEMAKILGLSRARFYQLLDEGVFPKPIYCLRTKRPLYTRELQEQCLKVRETNIGVNGKYILFYESRQQTSKPRKKKSNPLVEEMKETLENMGLSCSSKEVSSAINELYPDGIGNIDRGVVVRELFRKLKSK